MNKDMENGEGMALAAEAMTIVMAHPVEQAIEQLKPFIFDATSPEELLLWLHARYRWPLGDLASVLLTVESLDAAPTVEQVSLEQPDDTLLPMRFRLENGNIAQTPHKEITVNVVVEHELPDKWNANGPHTSYQLERRSRIAEDIGLYFSEGAAERMRTENPNYLIEAYGLIEPFNRYSLGLQGAKKLVENLDNEVDLRDQRFEELGVILSADTGLEHMKEGARQELTTWLMGLLGELALIAPTPKIFRNIPTRHVRDMRDRDAILIEDESLIANQALKRLARDALTDLTVYLNTSPDSSL